MVDLLHIKGQEFAKRALEIAAAGNHNLAMWGPPGTGKTMLAQAFPHLLPDLQNEHSLEVTGIHSVAGTLRETIMTAATSRAAPIASYPAVIGGGMIPKPERYPRIAVFFLMNFPSLTVEPLSRSVNRSKRDTSASRAQKDTTHRVYFARRNEPVPKKIRKRRKMHLYARTLASYTRKLPPYYGPHRTLGKGFHMSHDKLAAQTSEATEAVRERIEKARVFQQARFTNHPRKITTNSEMRADDIETFINLLQNRAPFSMHQPSA